MNRIPSVLLATLAFVASILPLSVSVAEEPSHKAVQPAPRDGGNWKERHERFNAEVNMRRDEIKLLFIGDSITDAWRNARSEEHTSELQSQSNLVCRLLLEKKKKKKIRC